MTASTKFFPRFRGLTLLALLALALQLQGCVEMAAVGVGAAVMASEDRRSVGAQTEDKDIDLRGEGRVNARFGDKVHVSVTSYNRNVLLTGEVPDEAAKVEIEKIVRAIPNVRGVVNEIQIAGVSSYTSRGNDSYLTSKVKARFVEAGKFGISHVKVLTESGAVYLLGLVTRKEADDAVEIARTTGG
ncbi:MAG: BON domain-containing protein, partial [Pseudomonadota bacterium]